MARKLSLPVIGLLLAGAALGACRDEGGKGEYFAISGKLFEFNYRAGEGDLHRHSQSDAADGRQPGRGGDLREPGGRRAAGDPPEDLAETAACDAREPAADLRRQGQALCGVDQHRRRRRRRWCRSSTPRSSRRSTRRSCRTGRWSSVRSTNSTRNWRAIRTGACPSSRSRTARPRCRRAVCPSSSDAACRCRGGPPCRTIPAEVSRLSHFRSPAAAPVNGDCSFSHQADFV